MAYSSDLFGLDNGLKETGCVHAVYQETFADGCPAMFYLCWWKNMIMEARDNLVGMGYTKEHIKFELYD
jgi:hypothetical protein